MHVFLAYEFTLFITSIAYCTTSKSDVRNTTYCTIFAATRQELLVVEVWIHNFFPTTYNLPCDKLWQKFCNKLWY